MIDHLIVQVDRVRASFHLKRILKETHEMKFERPLAKTSFDVSFFHCQLVVTRCHSLAMKRRTEVDRLDGGARSFHHGTSGPLFRFSEAGVLDANTHDKIESHSNP